MAMKLPTNQLVTENIPPPPPPLDAASASNLSLQQQQQQQLLVTYSGDPLDRVSGADRSKREFLHNILSSPTTRYLPMHQLRILALTSPTTTATTKSSPLLTLSWKTADEMTKEFGIQIGPHFEDDPALKEQHEWILLGIDPISQSPLVAIDVTRLHPDQSSPSSVVFSEHEKWLELRAITAQLSREEAAIAAHSRSLMQWHLKHRFCSCCGMPTVTINGGAKRICLNNNKFDFGKFNNNNNNNNNNNSNTSSYCNAEHHPRVDPVVIMCISKGDKVLLGRKNTFPPGVYSCLAGFIEAAESVEEAVRREVNEESGIQVGQITYVASQPWPFPFAQLMIGCFGEALTEDLHPDDELEDVRWFSLTDVRSALQPHSSSSSSPNSPGLRLPPQMALANQLMRHWVQSRL